MSTHRHHRKRRSQGGDDSGSNILLVSPETHNWIHNNVDAAKAAGWLVESWQDPADVPVRLPDFPVKPKKDRKPKAPAKARNRAVVALRVPKDEQEDGAGILDDLIDQARERLAPELGLDDDCPAYYVLVPLITDWLNS